MPWPSTASTSAGESRRVGQGRADDPLLGRAVGGGQPVGGAVGLTALPRITASTG